VHTFSQENPLRSGSGKTRVSGQGKAGKTGSSSGRKMLSSSTAWEEGRRGGEGGSFEIGNPLHKPTGK